MQTYNNQALSSTVQYSQLYHLLHKGKGRTTNDIQQHIFHPPKTRQAQTFPLPSQRSSTARPYSAMLEKNSMTGVPSPYHAPYYQYPTHGQYSSLLQRGSNFNLSRSVLTHPNGVNICNMENTVTTDSKSSVAEKSFQKGTSTGSLSNPACEGTGIITPPPSKRFKFDNSARTPQINTPKSNYSSLSSPRWPIHSSTVSRGSSKTENSPASIDPYHSCTSYSRVQMQQSHTYSPHANLRQYSMAMQSINTARIAPVSAPSLCLLPGGYSRKDKALGLLAKKVIQFYEYQSKDNQKQQMQKDVTHNALLSSNQNTTILSIDQTAKQLGVERRRIYDIINILEALDVVSKKGKNMYWWYGLHNLQDTLQRMQREAICNGGEFKNDAFKNGMMTLEEVKHLEEQQHKVSASSSHHCNSNEEVSIKAYSAVLKEGIKSGRKNSNGSLGMLSKKFLQLYLVGYDTLSLGDATERLLGDEEDTVSGNQKTNRKGDDEVRGWKTKVRRLYDIANVLVSVGIVDKITISTPIESMNKCLSGKASKDDIKSISTHKNNQHFCWKYLLSPKQIKNLLFKTDDNNSFSRNDMFVNDKMCCTTDYRKECNSVQNKPLMPMQLSKEAVNVLPTDQSTVTSSLPSVDTTKTLQLEENSNMSNNKEDDKER